MAALDLAAVMDAIAVNLSAVTGLRCYGWPTDNVAPPAGIVGYPADIEFDLTFQRGSDRATFPVWVLVGKAYDRASRDLVAAYIAGVDDVKEALDGDLPVDMTPTVQSCRVTDCRIEVVPVGGVDYLAARFELDVIA